MSISFKIFLTLLISLPERRVRAQLRLLLRHRGRIRCSLVLGVAHLFGLVPGFSVQDEELSDDVPAVRGPLCDLGHAAGRRHEGAASREEDQGERREPTAGERVRRFETGSGKKQENRRSQSVSVS